MGTKEIDLDMKEILTQEKSKMRIRYAVITFILFLIEVAIALFVHDKLVRPYVGDILVTVLIYTFLRILIPKGVKLLPLYVFLFAAGVEVLQYFNIIQLLGLSDNRFFSVLIGSVFDIKDIVCYGIGCVVATSVEILVRKYGKNVA